MFELPILISIGIATILILSFALIIVLLVIAQLFWEVIINGIFNFLRLAF